MAANPTPEALSEETLAEFEKTANGVGLTTVFNFELRALLRSARENAELRIKLTAAQSHANACEGDAEAAEAERDQWRSKFEALQSAQTYLYIGKDGKPITARDLEDQRDDAIAAFRKAFDLNHNRLVEEIDNHGLRAENSGLKESIDSLSAENKKLREALSVVASKVDALEMGASANRLKELYASVAAARAACNGSAE